MVLVILIIVVWLGKLFMDKLNEPLYKKYEIRFERKEISMPNKLKNPIIPGFLQIRPSAALEMIFT